MEDNVGKTKEEADPKFSIQKVVKLLNIVPIYQ